MYQFLKNDFYLIKNFNFDLKTNKIYRIEKQFNEESNDIS